MSTVRTLTLEPCSCNVGMHLRDCLPPSSSLSTSTPPFSTRFGRVLEAELQLCLRTLIACKRRQLDRLARHPQLFTHPRRTPVQCTPHAPCMRAIVIFEGALARTTILFAQDRLRKDAVQRASVGESTECCPSFFSPSSSTQAITVRRQSSSSTSAMTLPAKSPSEAPILLRSNFYPKGEATKKPHKGNTQKRLPGVRGAPGGRYLKAAEGT